MPSRLELLVGLCRDVRDAVLIAQEAEPDKWLTHLEYVAAERVSSGEAFTLIHEPDGPWLAISPLDDAAYAVMEMPASEWAERQRWDVVFTVRCHRGEAGGWEVDMSEVVGAL